MSSDTQPCFYDSYYIWCWEGSPSQHRTYYEGFAPSRLFRAITRTGSGRQTDSHLPPKSNLCSDTSVTDKQCVPHQIGGHRGKGGGIRIELPQRRRLFSSFAEKNQKQNPKHIFLKRKVWSYLALRNVFGAAILAIIF